MAAPRARPSLRMTARSSSSLNCPGCGTVVERRDIPGQFLGDVVRRPLRIGRCVAIGTMFGIVLGVGLGIVAPQVRYRELSLGALLGALVAIMMAKRYNDRLRAMPLDLWPNSTTCPKCGRVFGRYEEGGDPPVPVWP
jgi:endogenous inhibitor of DNA gyrase (YacG/DUF329 family)